MKYLITVGHLGRDSGAVAPAEAHPEGIAPLPAALQQERYMNLQQVLGFVCAACADRATTRPDVLVAVPAGSIRAQHPRLSTLLRVLPSETFTLEQRVKLANDEGRFLIEFHNNAAANTNAQGFEILVASRKSSSLGLAAHFSSTFRSAGLVPSRKGNGVISQDELGRRLFLLNSTKGPAIILEGDYVTSVSGLSRVDVDLDGWNNLYGVLAYQAICDYEQSLLGGGKNG